VVQPRTKEVTFSASKFTTKHPPHQFHKEGESTENLITHAGLVPTMMFLAKQGGYFT